MNPDGNGTHVELPEPLVPALLLVKSTLLAVSCLSLLKQACGSAPETSLTVPWRVIGHPPDDWSVSITAPLALTDPVTVPCALAAEVVHPEFIPDNVKLPETDPPDAGSELNAGVSVTMMVPVSVHVGGVDVQPIIVPDALKAPEKTVCPLSKAPPAQASANHLPKIRGTSRRNDAMDSVAFGIPLRPGEIARA